MSYSGDISLYFATSLVPSKDIVISLQSLGWHLNTYGYIQILPLGDKDGSGWIWLPLSESDRVFEILNEKDNANEMVGIFLTWKKSRSGVMVIIDQKGKEITFMANVNRRRVNFSKDITDIGWYVKRILPALLPSNMIIERIVWTDQI